MVWARLVHKLALGWSKTLNLKVSFRLFACDEISMQTFANVSDVFECFMHTFMSGSREMESKDQDVDCGVDVG